MSDFFLITAYLLASRIRRRWFTVIATIVAITGVLAQAVSRLYLGYHWFTDVSASVALSLVIVGTIIAVDTRRTVRVAGEPIRGSHSTLQADGT
jgi:undecaprenyl-diphosphatase